MAINAWWDRERDQVYWMEIVTTGAMGEMLIAPRFPGASWSYDLVSHVAPSDRVLHWQSTGGVHGLVGWSVVTGEPEVVPEYTWQPRGTAGRALPGPRTTEGWMVTLGGINRFTRPFTSSALQGRIAEVLAVAEALEADHRAPLYFPFYLYGGRQLRAQQGYLLKFPLELFDVLPGLESARQRDEARDARLEEDPVAEDASRPKTPVPRGRVTRVQDPRLRSALENHAVDRAIDYYSALGGSNFEKLGKPYDVRLWLRSQERHVEVKGSSLDISTVELTINEVNHAANYEPTDLVVVDRIDWRRDPDGSVTTSGGRLRVWSDWRPAADDLSARRFAYSLPPEP